MYWIDAKNSMPYRSQVHLTIIDITFNYRYPIDTANNQNIEHMLKIYW